jgi:hypothetical protein
MGLEVHHLTPVHLAPELELVTSNLITLCERNGCHFRVGHCFDWRAFNPQCVRDAMAQRQMILGRKTSL